MKRILILILLIPVFIQSFGQFKQTIRGVVIDQASKVTLPGASISLKDGDKPIGTTTDENGIFELKNVPIDRYEITVSFLGYEPFLMKNLELTSGKEKVLTIELVEKVENVKEIVVTSTKKGETQNKMATISARTFSVKETERYAGSLGDPSRMASNFAGVITANDSRNDIIIRGNSPQGLLWRLEGINIPNPNHFGALGSTGGPVSILNNNVLTNSDFFTGAFPAEYGNALSGVFDLKMKNGNNKKHEFTGQVGFNGFEFGAEGPISKQAGSSYMIDYRYSVLSVMKLLNLDVADGAVPEYQDLTLRLNFPTKKLGTFSAFAIGGVSSIEFADTGKEGGNTYNSGQNGKTSNGSQMGVAGITHRFFPSSRSNIYTTVSASYQGVSTQIDSVFTNLPDKRFYGEGNKEIRLSASTRYTLKVNSKNTFKAGANIESYNVNYSDSVNGEVFNPPIYGKFIKQLNTKEDNINLVQGFGEWQHHFSNRFTVYGGLFSQFFIYNSTFAIDPRASLTYKISESGKISFAYGKHSQMQPLYVLLTETYNRDQKTYDKTNRNLEFSKANHFVVGYDQYLAKNLKLKIEGYYQGLYDIPIKNYNSYFSMVNAGSSFHQSREDSLVNKGLARNYGAEITLEKYLDNNYYFLITTSLFNSKYLPSDGIWRNTEFNTNYVVNALAGYEIPINGKMSVDMNVRMISSGGKRNLYIDLNESIAKGEAVYDYSKAYSEHEKAYFRFDARVSLKLNGKRITQEWALDVTNLTNHQNVYTSFFSTSKKAIDYVYQQGLFPMMLYRINF
jgi:hypothetical protein